VAYDPDQEQVDKMKEIESAAVGLAELQEAQIMVLQPGGE